MGHTWVTHGSHTWFTHLVQEVVMPKQRAAGAAKPYRYWHTYKVVGEDGKTVTRRS